MTAIIFGQLSGTDQHQDIQLFNNYFMLWLLYVHILQVIVITHP